MKYAYDIHLHSVLSPCVDELMTPNNILNMAYLNELDIISVTDHNSMKQLKTIFEVAESYDFIVIPGVEIQVEGGHLLAYFSEDTYLEFDKELEKHLKPVSNEEEQVLMDVFDQEIANYDISLQGDIDLSLSETLKLIKEFDGVVILAHLNKTSFSLKDIVKEEDITNIDGIELINNASGFFEEYPIFKELSVYRSSDSHTVTSLARRENFISMSELSVNAFLEAIRR